MQRLSNHPRSGRPSAQQVKSRPSGYGNKSSLNDDHLRAMQELYLGCKQHLSTIPAYELISNAQTHEEASFYISVSDFFLKQKQHELIERGVF